MINILLITSSPRGGVSYSTKVAEELAEKLQAASPGSTITKRDLVRNPLPHIVPDYSAGIYLPADARTSAQAEVIHASDTALDELFAAKHIILATGMINFSISSTLKSWIDHIARVGVTFRYGANGPEGLIKGKKLYVVLASGGVYSEGPGSVQDFAVPYLKELFGFLGITDVEVIRIEGVGMGEEYVKAALAQASTRINRMGENRQ